MTSNVSYMINYSTYKEYAHDLKEIKKATSKDLIWLDKKNHLHCSGLFVQMCFKIEHKLNTLFGRVSQPRKEVDSDLIARILNYGQKMRWVKSGERHNIEANYRAYEKAHAKLKVDAALHEAVPHIPVEPPAVRLSKEIAATKIQAAFRGWKIRQVVVKPSQIVEQLKQHVIDDVIYPDELELIGYGLCREINSVSLEGKLKRGEGYKLDSGVITYLLPVFRDNDTNTWKRKERFKIKFDFWVALSEDGKNVSLLFKANKELRSGTYKRVFKAQEFQIRLKLDQAAPPKMKGDTPHLGRGVDYEPAIVFRSEEKDAKTVLDGFAMQKKLSEDAKGLLVETPVFPTGKQKKGPLEMQQTWYNSDLDLASLRKSIPLDLQDNGPRRNFTHEDTVKIVTDVASALEALHKKGIIHRDIKGPNILVKVEKDGEINGYLADFDLVTTPGKSMGVVCDYAYWDASTKEGWPLPLSDCYGLAFTLAECTVPNFYRIRDNSNNLTAANLDAKKAEAFKMSINQALSSDNFLYHEMTPCKTKQDILQTVNRLLKKQLTDAQRELLLSFRKEAIIIDFSLKLVLRVIQDSNKVHEFLEKTSNVLDKLTGKDNTVAQRNMAAKNVLSSTKYLTAALMKNELKALQNELARS